MPHAGHLGPLRKAWTPAQGSTPQNHSRGRDPTVAAECYDRVDEMMVLGPQGGRFSWSSKDGGWFAQVFEGGELPPLE